jgi:hypothetical protein
VSLYSAGWSVEFIVVRAVVVGDEVINIDHLCLSYCDVYVSLFFVGKCYGLHHMHRGRQARIFECPHKRTVLAGGK